MKNFPSDQIQSKPRDNDMVLIDKTKGGNDCADECLGARRGTRVKNLNLFSHC